MKTVAEVKNELRNLKGGAKISFQLRKNEITYQRPSEKEKYTVVSGEIKVESEAQVDKENSRLHLLNFNYGNTDGSREQQEVMELFMQYWIAYANEQGLNEIQLDIHSAVGNSGYHFSNCLSLLAAAKLGFHIPEGNTVKVEQDRNETLYLRLAEYRKYDAVIADVEKGLIKKKGDETGLNFVNAMKSTSDAEVPFLMTHLQSELPFYSCRLTWEGFVGYIAYYGVGSQVKTVLLEELKDETGIKYLVERMALSTGYEFVGDTTEKVLQYARESAGLLNALESPCVNLLEVLYKYRYERFNEGLAREIMEQYVAKGFSYANVEEEAVKMFDDSNKISVQNVDIMEVRGYYFELLNQYICVAYVRASSMDEDWVSVIVAEDEQEKLAFYQGILETELRKTTR